MTKFVEIALAIGVILLCGAVLTQDFEAVVGGLVALAVAFIWDFAHERRLTGADAVKRWRPSQRTLRLLAGLLIAFSAATAWGVYRGIIPSEMVVIMLAFVVAAPILAAPYLFFYRRAVVRSDGARDWPQVIGRVETSFMEDKVSDWAAPIVIYTYSVDGHPYRGSRVRFGGTAAMNPNLAEQILASFPVGAEVPVFFNPEQPGQSTLLPQAGPNKGLLWIAGLNAGAALAAALFMALIVVLGLVDAALTAIVGHRVLP